jgi:hypothetical protein
MPRLLCDDLARVDIGIGEHATHETKQARDLIVVWTLPVASTDGRQLREVRIGHRVQSLLVVALSVSG